MSMIRLSALAACVALFLAPGCGPESADGQARRQGEGDDAGAPEGEDLAPPDQAAPAPADLLPPCQNLECSQVTCAGTSADGGPVTTTLSGVVYDPAGTTPLYNVLVYVPNAPLADFDDSAGVSCDRCGAIASGAPLVATLTDAQGRFTLSNVPVGSNVPLVIQVGKWRRSIPALPITIEPCQANVLPTPPDPAQILTRLPRNQAEGHLPKMALASGRADPLQCLLLKMGIDPNELRPPGGGGRVDYYVSTARDGLGNTIKYGTNGDIPATGGGLASGGAPDATTLTTSLSQLLKYDVVFLPCEATDQGVRTAAERQNVVQYANAGGRLFVTHFSYTWLAGYASGQTAPAVAPFPGIADWQFQQILARPAADLTAEIETGFPKGQMFSAWMSHVGASPAPAKIVITDPRHDVNAVTPSVAQRWIYGSVGPGGGNADLGAPNSVQHFTFNTPLDAGLDDMGEPAQCGRVVYSDFHVSSSALADDGKLPGSFPGACASGPLTPMEKALEFMIFDLSSCVQRDTKPPAPPPIL